MKDDNHHHLEETARNSATRRKVLLLLAFGLMATLTLVGVALATAPDDANSPGRKTQDAASQNPIAEKYKTLVMRVYFGDRAERDRLAEELNPEEVPTTGGFLTVIRDRDLYYVLTARGLRVEIDEDRSRRLSDPQVMIETFYSGYKTVEEIYTFLDQKVAAFPNLAEKIDIGDSWCKSHPGACTQPAPWNGYDLFVLHITNRSIAGPKPVFWADCGIHSREIAGPEVLMRFIDYLLNNYATNADARWLVDHHDIWLMPTANPDGHHIVEAGGGGSSPYYYRKNGNNTGGASCSWPPTPFNHFGVDNNRNFPFHWGCCGGSSTAVCDQTYRGLSAGSEPEDMAIVNKIRTLVPDQRGPGDTDVAPITTMGVYQNIHTDAATNLFPWGWTAANLPNYAETRNIAAHIAAPNAGGNGYPYGSIQEELYPVDGGSIDWTYGELGMASFSTEFGGGDFLPAFSCIDNPGCGSTQGIWPENRGMLIYLSKIARTPYLTSHGPDANNVVANPASVVQGTPSQLTASINFAWTDNAFTQNVGAAEYYIDTPPWAGGAAIPMNGTFNSATIAVNATINTTGLSAGRHIIFVRGRGVNNYQGFPTWGPIGAVFLDVTVANRNLLSAASSLTHGAAGTFEIAMPLTGTSGVECRASSSYNAVFTFDGAVTSGEVVVMGGVASVGSISFSGNTMTAQLSGVTTAEIVTLRVQNINGDGQPHGDLPFGFLLADVNGNRSVTATDVAVAKSQSGQPVDATNFKSDVNANGSINATDVTAIKSSTGASLP